MAKMVALLRAVNVSGKRPVQMARLVKVLESRELHGVTTYKASGNVIFESSGTPKACATLIHDAIAEEFGHDDVDVLVLRAAEARKVAEGNPLLERPGVDRAALYVAFPFAKVTRSAFDALSLPVTGDETAILSGGVIYLYYPHGAGRTKLTNGWLEKALGVTCTTRNWNTVLAISELVTA